MKAYFNVIDNNVSAKFQASDAQASTESKRAEPRHEKANAVAGRMQTKRPAGSINGIRRSVQAAWVNTDTSGGSA
jgi:hypothetical protein